MKIIFAGTPEFAAVALKALHAAGFEIPLVLTQPDRPAGRGMQLQASAVKQFALAHGIAGGAAGFAAARRQVSGQLRSEAHDLLHATPHDVMVVAAYGLILPRSGAGHSASSAASNPRVAVAALARRGADPSRDRSRRCGNRRDHHADGRRTRHRADAADASACRSRPTTPPAACTTSWPHWAAP